jgi:O-antigen/teichoic acid export membrane protein
VRRNLRVANLGENITGSSAFVGKMPTAGRIIVCALGLASLLVSLYVAPTITAIALAVLGLGVPLFLLVWSRPEFGLLALVFLTSSFVPADIVDLRLPIGGGLDLRDLVFLAMLGLLILRGFARARLAVSWWPVALPLLAFLGFALFSACYALFIQHVATNWALSDLRNLMYYAVFFVTGWAITQRRQLAILLAGMFLIADFTTAIVFLQQFPGTAQRLLARMQGTGWIVWQQSTASGGFGLVRIVAPGQVLVYFMMVLAFCLTMFARLNRRLRLISWLQFFYLGFGMVLTYTRAEWIAAALALGLIAAVFIRVYRARLAHYLVIGTAVLVLALSVYGLASAELRGSPAFANAVTTRVLSMFTVRDTLDTNSAEWRLFETREALRSISEHPLLGVGLGNSYRDLTLLGGEVDGWMSGSLLPEQLYRFTRFLHNSYLSIAMKMGVPALVCFLWFCMAFLVSGWQLYRSLSERSLKVVVLSLLAGFAGLLLWSVLHQHFIQAESTLIVGLMVGLVGVVQHLHSPVLASSPVRRGPAAQFAIPTTSGVDRIPGKKGQTQTSGRPSFQQGVILNAAATAVSIVALLVETMVAARLLSTDSFGIFALLVVVVNFLIMAVDFGCKTAVTQMLASSDPGQQQAIASNALVFRIVVLVAVSLIVWLARGASLLLDQSGSLLKYSVYIPAMLVAASLDELLTAALQGLHAYHHVAVAQLVRSVLRSLLSIVMLVRLNLGLPALFYSWIISYTASTAYQYLVLPLPKRLRWHRPLLGTMLRFGLPLQGDRFLWSVSGPVAVALLSRFLGASAVAFYNVASRIPNALQGLAQTYIDVYFPTMTDLLTKGKKEQACRMLDHSLRLLSFGLGLVALVAVLFGQQIIHVLFSDKYLPSTTIFGLLMIALQTTVLGTLLGYTLTAASHPEHSLGQNLIRTALGIVGKFVLIPTLGLVGPAYADLAAYYVANSVCVWLLRRSEIFVKAGRLVGQIALLWLSVALFWWVHPTALAYKAATVILFVVLNFALSMISGEDLRMVLPESVATRLGMHKEALPHGV